MNTNTNSTTTRRLGLTAFAVFSSFGALANSASASTVVAEYEFTGGSAASSATDPSATGENYIATVAPNTATYSGISVSSSNAYFFSFETTDHLTDAIASNDYHSFTLDVESTGATVSLESLDFAQEFWNTHTTLDFSVSVFIGTTDAYFDSITASDSIVNYTINGSDYANGDNALENRSVDLSVITDLQNLTSDAEIRFYFYDNSSATDRTHRLDNIVLSASSVIPEPSSAAVIFAFVALGSAVFLKRGKRNA
tara:strand:- start:12237 stop:12998 length:762 start_codon:yes stop_codon:yes gene_type:complete